MKVLLGSNGSGKTVELIKMSSKTQTPILVNSLSHEKIYLDLARGLGLSIPNPVYGKFELRLSDKELGKVPPKKVLVDSLQEYLPQVDVYTELLEHTILMQRDTNTGEFLKTDINSQEISIKSIDKSQLLLDLMNELWSYLQCVNVKEFNSTLSSKNNEDLINFEKLNPKIGINGEDIKSVTTISLLSTVTDILIDKRLAAVIDDNKDIVGWTYCNTVTN